MAGIVAHFFSSVLPLVGVLIGGFITVLISRQNQKHSDKSASRDFKAKKLELLHEKLVDLQAYGRHWHSALCTAARKGGLNDASSVRHGLPEIEFFIRVLFPDKPDLYDDLERIVMKEFGGQVGEAITRYGDLSAQEKAEKMELIFAMSRRLEDQVAKVKSEIYLMMIQMLPD